MITLLFLSIQALDTDHREKMAEAVLSFSLQTQFIATTFRPELLRKANSFNGVGYNKSTKVFC